ncbi:MAG: helix-turn-helix transcriptional regulator [Hyphomicrobiales bacterium]|nr:helix-turn-helix transcriptional regulator [Hyphomicrobiales bacterium]
MEIRELVGWNLRRLRVMRNISQDDLALSADIERAYVGHMERGKKNPTVATLDKLASALDCDVADFFYRPAVSHEIIQPLLPGRKKG